MIYVNMFLHQVRQFSSLVLSSTSNDSNASITQEEPEAELSDTMSAFGALEIMCSQHALLRSLWDSPLARQNAILTTIRSFGQQLLRPTCEWVSDRKHLRLQGYHLVGGVGGT